MFNIASINVQNKYKLKKYDGTFNGEDHTEMLFNIIKKYDLDIVGLQEVNYRYKKRLNNLINDSYHMFGKFRFPDFFLTRLIPLFSRFNECVPIITNKNVTYERVITLPWISSYIPRIVTIMNLELDGVGVITVLNTHIDNRKPKTKIKQVEKLFKIIKKINNPVILMGDFNMTLKNKNFRSFIKKLEELGIYRVDINQNTFRSHRDNYSIDHIFLSSCFKVNEVIVERDEKLNNFSDHFPVIVKLDINR